MIGVYVQLFSLTDIIPVSDIIDLDHSLEIRNCSSLATIPRLTPLCSLYPNFEMIKKRIFIFKNPYCTGKNNSECLVDSSLVRMVQEVLNSLTHSLTMEGNMDKKISASSLRDESDLIRHSFS